jgi:DNA-binding NtrC family response regulator
VPTAFTQAASISSAHIFLAEADEDVRAEIAAALRRDGHEVVECADGATLFVELEHRLSRPGARRSLVIAQARLPGLSALRILHSLRQLDIEIPMILMTRLREPSLHDLAEKAGASAVLLKPVHLDDLQRAVAKVVETIQKVPRVSAG